MEIEISNKIIFKSLSTKIELQQNILNMINESNVNKIIYHGESSNINYKMIKKLFITKEEKKNKITPEILKIKEKYSKILNLTNDSFCIIYKK